MSRVVALTKQKERPAWSVLLVLMGAVALVLLVGCADVFDLLLARAQVRLKEMAIRPAVGANSRRLIRQLLTESVMLSDLGGGLGLLLAGWAVDLMVKFGPDSLPRILEVNLDMRVMLFTLIVSFATGLLFGLAPAVHSSRVNLNE